MATSTYFNSSAIGGTGEQYLMEDLIIETIKNHGVDVYVIPYESANKIDLLYGEDPLKRFDQSFLIEMYLVDNVQYDGPREFFAKFGLEIRDNLKFAVARRPYLRYIPPEFQRSGGGPREGDLIWIPLTNSLFEMKNVEGEKDFFMLGRKKPYFFEIACERFRYNNEQFNSGLKDLDQDISEHAYAVTFSISALNGTFMPGEQVFQMAANVSANLHTSVVTGKIIAFDATNMTLNIGYTKGVFSDNLPIYGANSSAYATVLSIDSQDVRRDDIIDNKLVQTESDAIINFSETNPFGTT